MESRFGAAHPSGRFDQHRDGYQHHHEREHPPHCFRRNGDGHVRSAECSQDDRGAGGHTSDHGIALPRWKPSAPTRFCMRMAMRLAPLATLAPTISTRIGIVTTDPPPATVFTKPATIRSTTTPRCLMTSPGCWGRVSAPCHASRPYGTTTQPTRREAAGESASLRSRRWVQGCRVTVSILPTGHLGGTAERAGFSHAICRFMRKQSRGSLWHGG